MHVDSSQPLGPRPPGRPDAAPFVQRPSSEAPGRATPLRDVYESASERPDATAAGPDRLELSNASRQLGRDLLPGPRGPETPEARAARVVSLAREMDEGRLFTPERMHRAVIRLLGGE